MLGGALLRRFVITNAAKGHPNVKALVYIDAFAPDGGETAFDLVGPTTSCVNDNGAFNPVPFGGGGLDACT